MRNVMYEIENGSITDFATFVMECAKTQEPIDRHCQDTCQKIGQPVPDWFKADVYTKDRLRKAKQELDRLKSLTLSEIKWGAVQHNLLNKARQEQRNSDIKMELRRYYQMLDLISEWKPPTDQHIDLKKDIITNLNTRIRISSRALGSYPVVLSEQGWYESEVDLAQKYHDQAKTDREYAVQKARDAGIWVRQLKKALSISPAGE